MTVRGFDSHNPRRDSDALSLSAQPHVLNFGKKRWALRLLSGNPKANLVIMGDFNEGKPAAGARYLRPKQ